MLRANDEVAAALGELAELMAIAGGDSFRIRAYEKAARAVAEHALDVDTLDEHALTAIPGVGSHIAAKITEVSRSAATRPIGAKVIAHTTIA